ncbi:MAG: GyrI-like domain-containing protein [bacterium]
MKLDFKKLEKQYYQSKTIPTIVNVEKMKFITFYGKGNPGEDNSEFMEGISLLYPLAYTLSMSYKSEYKINNFQNFVVAPLEGYWWQEGINGYDNTRKDLFRFILKIRLPEFINESDFAWAKEKASLKNKDKDYNKITFEEHEEGLVVQCLHIGAYDDEFITTKKMEEYLKDEYFLDFSDKRHHHEIYLSDNRKTEQSKLKTILRHPIKINVK